MIVLIDRLRVDPLAWIHRREARGIARELETGHHRVAVVTYGQQTQARSEPRILLRLSDPVMREATAEHVRANVPYAGPGAAALERCYDKYEATRAAAAAGIACPETALAHRSSDIPRPRVLKPRRGSDSIGLRLLGESPVPERCRNERYIVQRQIFGREITIAVFRAHVGAPLGLLLPLGRPHSFIRKYLLPPNRTALADDAVAARVRALAERIARMFGVDWAARIDLIHETASDRLVFLECDAAPLVGTGSAWAASFEAAGINRADQLRFLLRR
ncbi:MAG: ATP-grasp domain-containing protein [Betaproteobacteria bacterium]|nr:ATP-grasp domain-containing protein [Betaproteobacteria bacterium]